MTVASARLANWPLLSKIGYIIMRRFDVISTDTPLLPPPGRHASKLPLIRTYTHHLPAQLMKLPAAGAHCAPVAGGSWRLTYHVELARPTLTLILD